MPAGQVPAGQVPAGRGLVGRGLVKPVRHKHDALKSLDIKQVAEALCHVPRNHHVYLTYARPDDCVATADLFDRAHGERSPLGGLKCAASGGTRGRPVKSAVANATPRRYPASAMTSRGVAFDSAYDETFERARALAGIIGVGGRGLTMAEHRNAALERMGSAQVRFLARWESRGNDDGDD